MNHFFFSLSLRPFRNTIRPKPVQTTITLHMEADDPKNQCVKDKIRNLDWTQMNRKRSSEALLYLIFHYVILLFYLINFIYSLLAISDHRTEFKKVAPMLMKLFYIWKIFSSRSLTFSIVAFKTGAIQTFDILIVNWRNG